MGHIAIQDLYHTGKSEGETSQVTLPLTGRRVDQRGAGHAHKDVPD